MGTSRPEDGPGQTAQVTTVAAPRVLVVDDDALLADLVVGAPRDEGVETPAAGTSVQAGAPRRRERGR